MKLKISLVLSICIGLLLFVIFSLSIVRVQIRGTAVNAQSGPKAPELYLTSAGSCPTAKCPLSSQCSNPLNSQGAASQPAVYPGSPVNIMYCVYYVSETSKQNCAYTMSCPTSENGTQTCGVGKCISSPCIQRQNPGSSSGYNYVSCSSGSLCDGGPNDNEAYWCTTPIPQCDSSYGVCGCKNGCTDGPHLDYQCCHRKWSSCSGGVKTCGTSYDGTPASEANECTSDGATSTSGCPNPDCGGSNKAAGAACCANSECNSGWCNGGFCNPNPPTATPTKKPTATPTPGGGSCSEPTTSTCGNGVCSTNEKCGQSSQCQKDCGSCSSCSSCGSTSTNKAVGCGCSSNSQCASGCCDSTNDKCESCGGTSSSLTTTTGGGTSKGSTPTSTPTPTATPTPTSPPGTYSISGAVFVDTDGDCIRDASESTLNGARTISYTGPKNGSVTTNSLGVYAIEGLGKGTYTISLPTAPSGYAKCNGSSISRTITSANITGAQIGVIKTAVPTATPTPEPTYRISGAVFVDENGDCIRQPSERAITAAFRYSGPKSGQGVAMRGVYAIAGLKSGVYIISVPIPPSGYAKCNGSSISRTITSANITDAQIGVTSTVIPTATPTPAGTPIDICGGSGCSGGGTTTGSSTSGGGSGGIGGIVIDSGNNNCESGATQYTGPGQVQLFRNTPTTQIFPRVNLNGSGGYAVNGNTFSGRHTLVVSGLENGYKVNTVRDRTRGDTDFARAYSSGYIFNLLPPNSEQIDFCISADTAWFQTDYGDVRFGDLNNPVPVGQRASSQWNTQQASVFYSTISQGNLGGDTTPKWKVSGEYDYNGLSIGKTGSTSYTYYLAQARRQGVPVNQLNCISTTRCDIDVRRANLPVGQNGIIYQYTSKGSGTGELVINSYRQDAGIRVILLVDGDIRIKSNVDIANDSQTLAIFAASGDIIFDSSVGNYPANSATVNVGGIYTAERNIIIEKNPNLDCNSSNPAERDRQLVVSGSLIANALRPFDKNIATGGKVVQQRSLCQENATNPSLVVKSRFSFITALTDFYKITREKWSEVQP